MMYRIKNIIIHDEDIILPKCMYNVKKIFDFDNETNVATFDLKISEQVIKFMKISDADMAELENRQECLLKKLDVLYNRIVKISSICDSNIITSKKDVKPKIIASDEVVVSASPDNIPWYLCLLAKEGAHFNVAWHIHSSIPTDKLPQIKAFAKNFGIPGDGQIHVRLIFNNVSADTELKLSSLAVPIRGDVNVLRYLSLVYPNTFPSSEEFTMDSLLDLCHLLLKASEKTKEGIAKKIFAQCNGFIHNNQFSIADIAAHNVIKQWRNCPKYVPNDWFKKCEQLYV